MVGLEDLAVPRFCGACGGDADQANNEDVAGQNAHLLQALDR
jgi:hypothetical protein